MPIHGKCPGCGRSFQAPDKLAGKRVKCPNCSAGIDVAASDRQRAGRPTASAEEDAQTATPTEQPSEEEQPSQEKAQWYVKTADGEQLGPMSKSQVDALVAEGRLDGFCRVRREDWQQWKWPEAVYPQFALPVEPETQKAATSPEVSSQPAVEKTEPRLRACPDCNKMVSRRASQCPNCGSPLDTPDDQAAAQQTGETSSVVASSQKASGARRTQTRLLVAGAVVAVLLICVVAIPVGWLLIEGRGLLSRVEDDVRSLTPQPAIPSELPKEPADTNNAQPAAATPEEMQRSMEEAAAEKAKQVDDLYRQVHLAGSGLARFQKSADLMRSIIEDPLGDPGDDLTTAAETEVEPYQSQYKPLYEECISYIRENILADELDRSKVSDLGDRWADGKRSALDKQLLEQILTPQEP